jgi:hypothetical protein
MAYLTRKRLFSHLEIAAGEILRDLIFSNFKRGKFDFGKRKLAHSRKKWDFLTCFSLSKKFTYLAYKISYRKTSEINVKAKFRGFHFMGNFALKNPNDICIVKEF